ncbi:hypothetical protein RQP46_004083 [Phenoliferia psychrophenolica]
MGVTGLWKLVGPVARPIALESLAGKRLAIDASIWLYQFQKAMRDKKTGDSLQGAHIMGTFRRIMKLLFHGIKPVFVFDGDAPILKKRTVAERKRRKAGSSDNAKRTAQKLLSAQLRQIAANNALQKERLKAKGKEKQRANEEEVGDQIDENAVYLDDLDPDASPRKNQLPTLVASPKKYVPKDQYALPTLDGPLESRAKASDPRIATAEELRTFIDQILPEDFDIDSDFFGNLPIEAKYEIIGDLRVKSRQVNHRRVESMRNSATPLDFSRAQIDNLMKRNSLTQKLFSVTDALGQSSIAIPTRVAGERNREYLLVKQSADKGGGWVLGVRDPERMNPAPVVIEDSSDEDSTVGGTDSDEFEEVGIPKAQPRPPSPDVETRRALTIEAIRARYAPEQVDDSELDPYLDQPSTSRGASLFMPVQGRNQHDDEMMDPELQAAIMASLDEAPPADGPDESMAWLNETLFGKGGRPGAVQESNTENLDALDQGYASEESLEYVDFVEPDDDDPPPPPPPRPLAPAQLAAVEVPESDSDDSDAFETVEVVASHAPAAKDVVISVPSHFLPQRPPLRQPTPAALPPVPTPRNPQQKNVLELSSDPEPSPEPQQSASNVMSLMESILPSDDSDSESDLEVVESLPVPVLPRPSPITIPQSTLLATSAPATSISQAMDVDPVKAPASPPKEDGPEDELPVFRRRKRSRSPPVIIPHQSLFEPPDDFDEEPDFDDEEEAEEMRQIEREEANYASMMSQLKNRKLDDAVQEANSDVARLTREKNTDQRNADGVTRQMANDVKDLLMLFGIPYVDAPEEAEAECAELLKRHLVDGIVTDDSDVFLFGGARVYRNMFNEKEYVQCYLLSDLERELGLGRSELVDLAYLLGSDYVEGLPGVGPVSSRELLEDFRGDEPLAAFKEWWMKVQNGKDTPEDTCTSFRRKFKKKNKNLVLDTKWPDPVIARAYYHPVVNQEDSPFSWAGPDLDGLRSFLGNALSWASAKTDSELLPLIKRQNQRRDGTLKVQRVLTEFFDGSAGNGPLAPREKRVGYGSARLQNVVQSFRKKQKATLTGIEEIDSDDEDVLLPPRPPPSPAKRKKKDSANPAFKAPVASTSGSASAVTVDTSDSEAHAAPAKKASRKPAAKKPTSRAPPKTTAASRRRAEKAQKEARAVARGGALSSDEDDIVAPMRVKRPRAAAKKRPSQDKDDEPPSEGDDEEPRVLSAAMRRKKQRQAESDSDG